MAEGIIFGGYILSKEEFLSIFEKWYTIKHEQLKIDLQMQIINPIETMIKIGERTNSKGKKVSSIKRVKGQYDAAKIYSSWETITKKYFGNGAVTLIAAAKFGEKNFTWTNNIEEIKLINSSGINIQKKGLSELQQKMKDFESIYAAQEVQDFLNSHFEDLLKTLGSYTLNNQEAAAMHALLAQRKSALNNVNFSFIKETYDKIVFSSQRNAEGKKLDAFMNHVGKYNAALFSAMKVNRMDATSVSNLNLNDHGGFSSIFSNVSEVQPWLVDSLNSASWLSGGDIVIVNKEGAVIYNIQLKSTGKGKTFDVAASFLLSFAKEMLNLINEDKPQELAELMYNRLKTTTANDFSRTEEFFESAAYEDVRKKLGL